VHLSLLIFIFFCLILHKRHQP